MDEVRALAKAFRELADLYDELANIEENEELGTLEKEKRQEDILGKIMVQALKVEKIK